MAGGKSSRCIVSLSLLNRLSAGLGKLSADRTIGVPSLLDSIGAVDVAGRGNTFGLWRPISIGISRF